MMQQFWLLLLFLMGVVLLPSSVSANAGGPDGSGATTTTSVGWAAPAAILATLRSLSLALQSLFSRLASARLARGDHAGKIALTNLELLNSMDMSTVIFLQNYCCSYSDLSTQLPLSSAI